ncbi:MAG TPA: Flp pilus assembly protein CpaB [Rhizomicrobium sp.]|nr:Flp pilus assembly protein CpaB [Rhizomicrobium sp.]
MRTMATFALAAFLGLVAVLVARSFLTPGSRAEPHATAVAPGVPVVVAAQPLARGVPLHAFMLKVVNYPADAAPTEAFHTLAGLTEANGQPRLALRSMVTNEPVLPANVSGPGGKLNLSTLVSPGMRAVSLRANDVADVGGFVLPGDHVDILLTRPTGSNQQTSAVTQVLADNIRVLGIDQSDNDQSDSPVVAKVVTVEVTPEQAQSISLAESVGTVSLMLRHVADDAPFAHKTLTVADLAGSVRRERHGSRGSGIRVVRGVASSHFTFASETPAGAKTP